MKIRFLLVDSFCHDQNACSHWPVLLPITTNGDARFLQTAASPGSLQPTVE